MVSRGLSNHAQTTWTACCFRDSYLAWPCSASVGPGIQSSVEWGEPCSIDLG